MQASVTLMRNGGKGNDSHAASRTPTLGWRTTEDVPIVKAALNSANRTREYFRVYWRIEVEPQQYPSLSYSTLERLIGRGLGARSKPRNEFCAWF